MSELLVMREGVQVIAELRAQLAAAHEENERLRAALKEALDGLEEAWHGVRAPISKSRIRELRVMMGYPVMPEEAGDL